MIGSSEGSTNLATGEELLEKGNDPTNGPIDPILAAARHAHQRHDLKKAELLYRKLLNQQPPDSDAAAGLGALLRSEKRLREAGQHYRWALQECTWSPLLLGNACNWMREQGHAKDTLHLLQQGLQRWPDDLSLGWGLILSLEQSGQSKQALDRLLPLVETHGERPLLLHQLAVCQLSCNQKKEALATLQRLTQFKPNDSDIYFQRFSLLLELGQPEEARLLITEARCLPSLQQLHAEALLLRSEKRHTEAIPLLERLCRLEPKQADHWLNLAASQKASRQIVAPLITLQEAIELHPTQPALLQALGSLLVEHGRFQEGLPYLKRGADHADAQDVHQFNLQFAAAGSRLLPAQSLMQRAQKWEEQRQLQPSPLWADHLRNNDPQRRLRIGYLSQDFHQHPVGHFLEPLLEHHNKQGFEVIGIQCGTIHDRQTEKLKRHCDRWLNITQHHDLAAARLIAEQEPDLLIELGGYTGGQRLRLLTARPAPIQLSYLGYFAPTHLKCIDGWIGDHHVFPVALEAESSAQHLLRLPRCYMAYKGDPSMPLERTAKDQHFRFGCFNHSRKLSDPCLDLFAAILKEVPNSILVLKSQTFQEYAERERIKKRLMQRGIHNERLEILERTTHNNEHLRLYGYVDVALDTIPYGGATTTAESLWMGVPVLCQAGEGMVGCLAAAMMAGAGLESGIARSKKDLIQKAKMCAKRGLRDAKDRERLRAHLMNSELMDSAGLALAMETLYRSLWLGWLQSRGQSPEVEVR